jgi:manganese transport protein
MHGLLHIQVPLVTRRLVTLIPALVLLAIGVDPTFALVVSQVVLSFGIPFALIPLLLLTGRRSIMGDARNRGITTLLAIVAAILLIALNLTLLWLLVTGA